MSAQGIIRRRRLAADSPRGGKTLNPDSKFQFEKLEIHDGDLEEVGVKQDASGNWSLMISVHCESFIHQLQFRNCRSISTEIKGGMARADVIDKYEARSDTERFRAANSWPSPLPENSFHYSITTNSGSRIDVVAEIFEAVTSK